MSHKDIPFGTPQRFNAIVEIQKNSEIKYEYDEEWDVIKLNWIFTGGFHFPFDYGYVPLSDPLYQNCKTLKDLSFDYETIFTEFFREL